MVKKLGNFEILDQIDPGGYSIVYRARQDLGMGVFRPAAIKVLEGWKLDNEAHMAQLRKELNLMVQFASSPYIVQVWESGVEPGLGPWIAMEFLGKSLKHFIADAPSEGDKVRQVLSDVLNGLITIAELAPSTVHRDIKPNNILLGLYGSWKIADFGLAKVGSADDTLKKVAVQYAAPELLDSQRGTIGPWTDLYALGMTAYHYALGHKLFRAQFPGIYDPNQDPSVKPADERPKWMFWHTSQQTLRPVAELVPGFPKDMSDLIASLTSKETAKRPQSAKGAMGLLGARAGSGAVNLDMAKAAQDRDKPAKKETISKPVAIALAAMLLVAAVLGLAALVIHNTRPTPHLAINDNGVVVTMAEDATVRGKLSDLPPGGSARLVLKNGDEFPLQLSEDGGFTTSARLARVGKIEGSIVLRDADKNPIAYSGSGKVSLERTPPSEVEVVVNLSPLVEGASVAFVTPTDPSGSPQTTGEQGLVRAKIPRGKFELVVDHPRYVKVRQPMETGDDLSRPVRVPMKSLSQQQIDARRQALLAQVQTAALLAAQGDPEALKRLKEIQRELGQLDPDGRRRDMMDEVVALASAKGTTDGDKNRLQQALARMAGGGDSGALAALAKSPATPAERAGPSMSSATASNAELASAQARVAIAQRREELLNEMNDLQARAAAGDPYAQQRLKDIAAELKELEAKSPGAKSLADQRRAELIDEYARVAELAAKGDPDAIRRLAEIQKELKASSSAELAAARANERGVSSALASLAGLDPLALMKMPIPELRAFLSRQAPLDCLTLSDMPEINRIRVSGPVLSMRELQSLTVRLAPANDRVVPELGVDPLAVCRRIERALGDAGAANPRVRAAISASDELVYVQFDGSERFSAEQARRVAVRYVLNPDTLVIQDTPPVAR